MKQIQLIVVAMLLAVLIGGFTPKNEGVNTTTEVPVDPNPQEKAELPPSPEILAKRIEYRDAMRKVVDVMMAKVRVGMFSSGQLREAMVALAEAESTAAVTQEELESSLRDLVNVALKYEELTVSKAKVGVVNGDELAMATAIRSRVELMLLEAKHRATPEPAAEEK